MARTNKDKAPISLEQVSFKPMGNPMPSPGDWRDQVFYFLLPDRFSNGQESQANLFDPNDPARFKTTDKRRWMEGGKKFQGGTLKGIKSKLGYLRDLGITALWLGPIWKQRADLETYHGYGIQNYLDVDPRFGTRDDLRNLVNEAHAQGIYVILDIIYNHTGNNWFYDISGNAWDMVDYRYQPPYNFFGWRSGNGQPTYADLVIEDGIWPREFQNLDWYTRAGKIVHWDPQPWENPMHPECEFRRGDFFDLKDLDLDCRDDAMSAIIDVYKYWIAFSDADGLRLDTVKHASYEVCKNFCGAIHEYAESIGKENFFLVGEVTGGEQMAKDYLSIFGRNIDAVLDIGMAAGCLSGMVKGFTPPATFFDLYREGHDILGSHRESGRYHLSIIDDHDMVGRNKKRFAADMADNIRYTQAAHAIGTMLTTLGIPCIYYGSEQAFDGSTAYHDDSIEPRDGNGTPPFEDRYIRESMFGGSFGAFETEGCHFFNPDHPTYQRIAAIAGIRNRKDKIGLTLRRGRQYLREIKPYGETFFLPAPGELTAWSRVMDNQEVLVALNTHGNEDRGAFVTVDARLHPPNSVMKILYLSIWSDAELCNPPQHQPVTIEYFGNRATVRIDLPPGGMAILA
ncbi:MAG: alpha-amylase family glycosyl hydrolase [Desulfuromonadaceae bacterium]